MLKFSYYIDNKMDKAWFDSSNVVYAECDESDTAEKTVRVVFKNGSMYRYDNVNVYDWTLFKNSESQGKALNSIFKKGGYPCEKINTEVDLDALQEEYEFRTGNGVIINVNEDNIISILDNKDGVLYSSSEGDSTVDIVKKLLEKLRYVTKVKEANNESK